MAWFFICVSVISRERDSGRIIVGAKTTAILRGVICCNTSVDGSEGSPLQARETYKVFLFPFHNPGKVEDEKLQTVTVARRQILDSKTHGGDSFFVVGDLDGVQKLIVNLIRNQWGGKSTEVLLQERCDGVDVKVWVRNVKVVAPFKAFSNDLDLAISSALTVYAFHVHTCPTVSSVIKS